MKVAWLSVVSVSLFSIACSSSSGGGGGAASCADGGVCPTGYTCQSNGFCAPQNVGGGGGLGGSGAVGGSTGGFGGSGAFGGSTGGFGGSGAFGGSTGGFGGSTGGFGGSTGGFGGSTGGVGGGTGGFGGGTGGSTSVDCTSYCQAFLATGCPSDPTLSECVATCQGELNSVSGQCNSQANNWMSCIVNTATFSCQPDGQSGAEGCTTQSQAYIACGVCLFPTTDPCSVCNKSSCCSQMQGFWSDANAFPFQDCVAPCTTAACVDACISQFPGAGSKYSSWGQCQNTSCSSSCS